MIDYGVERDRVPGQDVLGVPPFRWWLFVCLEGEEGRPQGPRFGVVDRGFRFARGGRAPTQEAAVEAQTGAMDECRREFVYWRGQPSHALGPRGELVPLDSVLPELAR